MIRRIKNLTEKQLEGIRTMIGEAFVSNELFHNWGTEAERRGDVLKYMSIYVDYVYRAGELYGNEDLTGFIGLEDSARLPVMARIGMIFKMLRYIRYKKMKRIIHFANQVSRSNRQYAKQRHLDVLMVCVAGECQGKGLASELIRFAQKRADALGIPLLFDTDMKDYADMYRHFGCRLYNMVTADNGVTRYSLCYEKDTYGRGQ